MTSEKSDTQIGSDGASEREARKAERMLERDIGRSIDRLIEYMVDNDVDGIHPFIMGEIERRLIIKALERSRGNKVRAAKMLGMSRNTFHRKLQKLTES